MSLIYELYWLCNVVQFFRLLWFFGIVDDFAPGAFFWNLALQVVWLLLVSDFTFLLIGFRVCAATATFWYFRRYMLCFFVGDGLRWS